MGWLERQQEMKLDILESLARCQRAMARIIESAADAGNGADRTTESLLKSFEAIRGYQLAVAEKLCGLRIGEVRKTDPAAPWTNEAAGVSRCCSKDRQSSDMKPDND